MEFTKLDLVSIEKPMTTAYITHHEFVQHDMGYGHPECPDRLLAISQAMTKTGLLPQLREMQATPASVEQLQRVHGHDYIQAIHNYAPESGIVALDPDTSMCPATLSAALHAAGALVLATDKVLAGEIERAFCAVRPPGHHATPNAAMGFCFFNNVAVGAAHALVAHGLQRVAILDFDVHHGNGTQDIFSNDQRVLFCSTHQHPHYPFTGVPIDKEHIINTPLADGAGSREFRQAVETVWLPALDRFKPELIYFSAGFDAHIEDPLSMLNFVDEDYPWVTQQIVQWAKQHCSGRVISTLEGGYALQALGRSVALHVRALLEG